MRNACLVLPLAAVAFALVSCGGEDASNEAKSGTSEGAKAIEAEAPATPTTTTRTARCSASTFRISFVQTDRVTIESGEGVLAFASYSDRGVDARCPDTRPASSYGDVGLGDGVYQDVELSCTAPGAIEIHVNPIREGRSGPRRGSSLSVSDLAASKPQTIVAAVLENREQAPVASRIYFAPKYCQAA